MTLRLPIVTLALALITIAAFVLAPLTGTTNAHPEAAQSLFWLGTLDSEQPLQLWRLVSAHGLHTDWNHLLWNLVALALLASVIEQRSRGLLLIAIVLGMAFVNLWFFSAAPTRYYCGWSGVLNTLLIAALYTLYWHAPATSSNTKEPPEHARRRRISNAVIALIIVGALLKNLYELQSGSALVSAGRWESAPGAHLAGWLAGLLLVVLLSIGKTRHTLTKD